MLDRDPQQRLDEVTEDVSLDTACEALTVVCAYSCSSRSTQPSDVSSAATSRFGARPLPKPR
jgi:hypothetical protein